MATKKINSSARTGLKNAGKPTVDSAVRARSAATTANTPSAAGLDLPAARSGWPRAPAAGWSARRHIEPRDVRFRA